MFGGVIAAAQRWYGLAMIPKASLSVSVRDCYSWGLVPRTSQESKTSTAIHDPRVERRPRCRLETADGSWMQSACGWRFTERFAAKKVGHDAVYPSGAGLTYASTGQGREWMTTSRTRMVL